VLDIEKVSPPPGLSWDFGATLRPIYSEKAGQKRFRFYGYLSGTYILVVDRQISAMMQDFIISEPKDGEEALQTIPTFLPDLIFMDIRLPAENGLDPPGDRKPFKTLRGTGQTD
jgi:hypothetical protein